MIKIVFFHEKSIKIVILGPEKSKKVSAVASHHFGGFSRFWPIQGFRGVKNSDFWVFIDFPPLGPKNDVKKQ